MYFNPTTDAQSIVARLNRLTGADNTIYPLIEKANDCNEALDRFFYLAMTADGTFQFDDSNYTDLPIGTTNLVSGQQDYAFASDVMTVEKVLCKDSASGNWTELTPVDIKESKYNLHARNIALLPTGNTGIPTHYDKSWNSILLDPIPSYNSTGGLKVIFGRGPSYFISTDTTKQPGIPIIFHNYIYLYAGLQFLIDKEITSKIPSTEQKILSLEDSITDFFSHRAKDEPTRIKTIYRSSK